MSFEIVDALIHDQHFAVEAGVGIGKSFGYLVPVLLYNKKMKKPVIVATSTIALQEQLWDDVHDVMPLLNTDPEVILAKGQTHYLCHKRANEYLSMDGAVIPKELADGIEEGFQERKQFPPFAAKHLGQGKHPAVQYAQLWSLRKEMPLLCHSLPIKIYRWNRTM